MIRVENLPVSVFEAGSGMPIVGRGTLVQGRLEVVLHDGRVVGFDLGQVDLTHGGASGTMFFLKARDHGATASVDHPEFTKNLRSAADGALDAALDSFGRSHRSRIGWDRIALGFVLVTAVAFLAFVAALPGLMRDSVDAIPRSVDRSIGDAMIGTVAPDVALAHDPLLDAAVAEIMARLEPHVSHDGFAYRTRILATPDVNAFALPGGQIVICAGLLARAERPEVVAGVLAHEIAHVTERHAVRGMLANLGIALGVRVLLGQIDFLPGYAQDGAMLAAMRGFSREEELEADSVGFDTLVAAGLDPEGLADVFRSLARIPGTEMPGMISWISTHPQHDERIANIEARIRARGGPTPAPMPVADWPAVRAAADRALANSPLSR